MRFHRTYAWIGLVLFAFALGFVSPFVQKESRFDGVASSSAPASVQVRQAPRTDEVSLTIQSLYTEKRVPISGEETVLDLLQAQNVQDPEMHLVTREYEGLGTMIVAMHDLVNGAHKDYWQYKINGVMPQIGAGGYTLHDGDRVEWFFAPSQQ